MSKKTHNRLRRYYVLIDDGRTRTDEFVDFFAEGARLRLASHEPVPEWTSWGVLSDLADCLKSIHHDFKEIWEERIVDITCVAIAKNSVGETPKPNRRKLKRTLELGVVGRVSI